MMRSLFSGVSGLKTHQTRMDVIGNNIANVNTTAYKSQNMVFSDLLYQQTQAASGANADTGRGGINARQIGLGSKTAAINTAITRQGSAQSTNNPWDVMISGESFFIVNSGSQNFFTRDGSFNIDGAGNLVMASTGYRVMGWTVDEETGEIQSGPVQALQVMSLENQTAPAEATTMAVVGGILDKNDTNVHSKAGLVRTLQFFDARGYSYTAQFSIHALSQDGNYYVQLDDIKDSNSVSLKDYYNVNDISQIATFGEDKSIEETKVYALPSDGSVTYKDGTTAGTGTFVVNYNYGEILTGFSANVMMSMAENLKVTVPAADQTNFPANGDVTMQGDVTLDKSILQEKYGLTYDEKEKQYYYRPETVDANGNVTYGDRTALGPSDATTPATAINTAGWQAVLSKLGGNVTLATGGTPAAPLLSVDDKGAVTISFTAQFKTNQASDFTAATGKFGVTLNYPADKETIMEKAYGLHSTDNVKYDINYITPDGHASVTRVESYTGNALVFDTKTGKFSYVGDPEQSSVSLNFAGSTTDLTGANVDLGHFSDISIDFSAVSNVNNGKTSTVAYDNGDGSENNLGSGRKVGALIGIEIGQDGKIRASYDNGLSKLLGQIAVTKFANAAGLAKAGNNLYRTTLNSGEFDGTGIDITSDGEGSMESGVLEMSNVDLAGEFTEMITTQRGFQANSRIITTSDSMLEELVNLKR
ncbi:MAG: flagellar hook-basal body complex protein [Lachnospiraceae bacterium]|nr:flagellar hook-basal body complex protein [Lachnospiraceae bacterium]